MAVDSLVDGAKLDACCKAEADAIRSLTGSDDLLEYDYEGERGFADEILALSLVIPRPSDDDPQNLGESASPGSSDEYSRSDHVHALPSASDVGALPSNTTFVSSVNGQSGAVTLAIPSTAADVGAEPAVTEVTVSTAGAVTQALDAGKIYHFTGALTSLTITLNVTSGVAQYHFDFTEGSTAFDPSLPNSVVLPDNHTWEADTRYEVDILNNYAVVVGWTVS